MILYSQDYGICNRNDFVLFSFLDVIDFLSYLLECTRLLV